MDGLDVARTLRTRCPDLLIIILTARTDDIDASSNPSASPSCWPACAPTCAATPSPPPPQEVLRLGNLTVDTTARHCTLHGEGVQLRRKEFDYAAPRFLLPAYALLAVPVADALASATRSAGPRLRLAATLLIAALVAVQLVSQHAILTRAARTAADGTGDYARIAADLRTYGVRPPCLATGRLATPVAYQARCASGQVTGHNQNTTVAKVLATARHEPVAVLVRPHHKAPAYARRWTSGPLPGLRVHHGYRVYLSPG